MQSKPSARASRASALLEFGGSSEVEVRVGRDAGGMPGQPFASSGRNDGRDFTRAYQAFAASSSFHGTSPR
jgi:hypothetical protein